MGKRLVYAKTGSSTCVAEMERLINKDSNEGGNVEGLDGEIGGKIEQGDIINFASSLDLETKHRNEIEKTTNRLRYARDVLYGKEKCEVSYILTTEQYLFKRIEDAKVEFHYSFYDGKIRVVSRKTYVHDIAIVDGKIFTGFNLHSLRNIGGKATLVAVSEGERKLSKEIQTLYDDTAEEIARLIKEREGTDISKDGIRINLVCKDTPNEA